VAIEQKDSRTGDIFPMHSAPGMAESESFDRPALRIGKDGKTKSRSLTELTILLGRVRTDRQYVSIQRPNLRKS
jgi:hypothetical protein